MKSSHKKKKNKNVDLVKVNTDPSVVKKNIDKDSKKDEQIRIKIEKGELKAEKIRLLEERKIRESKENNKAAEAKIAKLKANKDQPIKNEISNNREKVNKIVDSDNEEIKPLNKNTKKNIFTNSVKTENVKSICDKIKDCDIDIITELLIKKGKDKPFPNISSN